MALVRGKSIQHGTHVHNSLRALNSCTIPVSDPRQVGDLCYNGYWGTYSLILAVETQDNCTWITQLNLSEPNQRAWEADSSPNVKKHLTRWDWAKDRLVAHGLHAPSVIWPWATYEDMLAELVDIAQSDSAAQWDAQIL